MNVDEPRNIPRAARWEAFAAWGQIEVELNAKSPGRRDQGRDEVERLTVGLAAKANQGSDRLKQRVQGA